MGDFSTLRIKLSQLGRRLSSYVSHCELSDPMSGFFLVDRRFLEEVVHKASGVGFKILLDLVASAGRPVRFAEVPYTFRSRLRGESKLDILVGLEYLQLLLDKSIGKFVPPRYVVFAMVGGAGVIVHLILLFVLQQQLGQSFSDSQLIASVLAMIFNFLLNNVTTYRDRRLSGTALIMGLLLFCVASAFGMFVNLQIADSLRQANWSSYLSGLVGLFVGSVWNYGVGAFLTWRRARS